MLNLVQTSEFKRTPWFASLQMNKPLSMYTAVPVVTPDDGEQLMALRAGLGSVCQGH